MMSRTSFKQLATVLVMMVMALSLMSVFQLASAQTSTAVGGGTVLSSPEDNIIGGQSDARSLVNTVLKYFLGFLGLLCTVMIIYGGILYVTSAGEEEKTKKGRNIILYAIIGIIIIVASYAIVNTVLKGVTQ